MAFLYKGEDDPRLHDPGYSLSYEELVQLASAAKAGNSAAAFRLAQLPATERRLAKSIDKAFSTKPGMKKAGKSRCIHCGKRECRCAGPQQPTITKAAAVTRSIKQDFLRNRHDPETAFDPGADATYLAFMGPEARRSYQAALLAGDPIRAAIARRHGISLDDLAPIPQDAP